MEVETCSFMDETPGHAHDGSEITHRPHVGVSDGIPLMWDDGSSDRPGVGCSVCHHVLIVGSEQDGKHTDSRLDQPTYGPEICTEPGHEWFVTVAITVEVHATDAEVAEEVVSDGLANGAYDEVFRYDSTITQVEPCGSPAAHRRL